MRSAYSEYQYPPSSLPIETVMVFAVVLCLDVLVYGFDWFSKFICPIWIVVSLVRSCLYQPGSRIACIRIAIPVMTLVISISNEALQEHIAKVHAEQIANASKKFFDDMGRYPKKLGELVPRYLPSVPRAKFCLFGDFTYYDNDNLSPGFGCDLVWFDGGGSEMYRFGWCPARQKTNPLQ